MTVTASRSALAVVAAVVMTAYLVLLCYSSVGVRDTHTFVAGHLSKQFSTGITLRAAAQWAAILSMSSQVNMQQVHVQRPNISSPERALSSPKFEAVTVHSLNPPDVKPAGLATLELASRLVIGIAIAVHSGTSTQNMDIRHLDFFKTALPSFLSTAHPGYIYRLYIAFDTQDKVYNNPSVRQNMEALFQQAVSAQDAKLWHPHNYQQGGSIDSSSLMISLHWVSCPYKGKPAWAQNDAAMAAFKEGADYVLRTNDDTQLPAIKGWESVLINDLRSRRPVPNLGVVGPVHSGGNTAILTHDFTHRTHAMIHGFYYPRSLPTWYADDWMTRVYGGFSNPPLMVKRTDVAVIHTLAPVRYNTAQPGNITDLVKQEVATGKEAVRAFIWNHFKVQPTK